ncbi:hypothetical protein PR001_g23309 [Phytophthora rubi]|uniref:Uncharacterized protein n=1 Tax=Phytophthora rubi TaxID=129364 RepID=A0A6A3IV21_9STRA|nr:hypothetical protein PR001_g23309 [Phytophthora rubi]
MEKQQSLIEKQVQAKCKPSSDDAMMSLKNLNLKKFTAKAKSVQEVAQASGLEVVDTPPNGNCQYYAVAMALLNRTFELGEDQTAVETLTAKLKKGILAASNHFFEEEYPHSSRMYLLRSINNHKQMKLTEDQSKTELRRYFSEIAGSTCSEMGCVRGNLWGSSETLRMMAKILQRKIFCVVAQPSFAEATYAYYDIKEKKQYGKTFTTAVERGFSANDVAKWLQALKTECNKMARTGISPLVILFTPGHYEWLRFSTHPKPFPQQDPEDEDSLMDIIADGQPSSEDADLMQTGSVCVRQDARSERQLDTERSTTTERQEEEDIKNFGGSRTEELKTFSTAGINGIAPGKRHELRDLDWDNEDVVTQWTTKYDISKSTLLDWQLQLLAEGSQSTFTPSLPSTQRSEESDWADETEAGSNHKAERERFFEDLAPWLTNHTSIVLAGDFNCVLNPARDRVKHRRKSTGPTESVMLERLKNRFDMTDAMNLVSHVEDEQDEHDPLNYYSYWKHDGASRLDRFYVTGEPYDQVQWVEAVEAAHDSDHREVRMELSSRGAGSNTEQSSVVYPIHTGRPQRVHDAIAAGIGKLMDTYETSKHPVKDWDGIITGLQRLLQDVKLADARQRKRYFANLRASTRNVFSSQAEIRTYEQEAGKRKATRSFGSNLQVSEENTRRFFKRNSDWQRDQTITRIVPSAGHFYSEDFPIEERMASEWSHVLSQSHATTSSSNYENEFNKFVRIPTEQQLTQNDAHRLVAPISEGETLDAIASLKRHKTAGTTGLNHDFYNYFAAELAPGLTLLFNAILNGEGVPESFLQATVAPLRKKGDSPDAMDYRPIALLNTAYKVFGRILADRLHCYLPRLISQSQQGFVRGRSIDKTITILKTILARSKADPLEAWTEAAMVLCLDLRKRTTRWTEISCSKYYDDMDSPQSSSGSSTPSTQEPLHGSW